MSTEKNLLWNDISERLSLLRAVVGCERMATITAPSEPGSGIAALLPLLCSPFACLDLPFIKAFSPLCCKSINSLNMWEVGGQAASESY